MIRSYRDRETERFAEGEKIRQWEPIRRQAEKRLRILDAATSLADLAVKGDRKGRIPFGSATSGAFVSSGPRTTRDRRMLRLSVITSEREKTERRKLWPAHLFTQGRFLAMS